MASTELDWKGIVVEVCYDFDKTERVPLEITGLRLFMDVKDSNGFTRRTLLPPDAAEAIVDGCGVWDWAYDKVKREVEE